MKKGFTLIETLAVITIIALLGLITIPAISKSLESNKKKAFKESISGIVDAVKIYRANNDFSDDGQAYDIINNEQIEYNKKEKIISGTISIIDGKYKANNISNGEYCANGFVDNLTITDGEC